MTEEKTSGVENMASILGGLGVPAEVTAEMTPAPAAPEAPVAPVGAPPVIPPPAVETPVAEAPVTPAATETPEAPTETPEAPAPEVPAEGSANAAFEVAIESPVYGGELKIGEASESPVPLEEKNYESIDSFSSFMKDTFEIESIKDIPAEMERLRAVEPKVNDLTDKINNANAIFENMHPDLYEAVVNDRDGKDWRESINSKRIDFTKEVDSFASEKLVETMSPGSLTKEDWEQYNDPDGDPAVKRLVDSTIKTAESLFSSKKSSFDEARNNSILAEKQRGVDFTSSVEAAKLELKNQFKDIDPSYTSEIENMLVKGTINNLFYDEKGMLKPDAMVRAIMTKDGKGLVDQWEGVARRRIETSTRQDILLRGADVPTTPQGSSATEKKEEISEDVKDAIAAIENLGGRSIY